MKERVALPQFGSAGLGTEIAVGAIGAFAFETGAKIEGADVVAPLAVGTGFFRVGELHGAGAVGLQQHLDQRVGAPLLAEVLLIVNEEPHEPRNQGATDADKREIPGGDQAQLIPEGLKE